MNSFEIPLLLASRSSLSFLMVAETYDEVDIMAFDDGKLMRGCLI